MGQLDTSAVSRDGATAPLAGRSCVVCGGPVAVRIRPWSARCDVCGTWTSDLSLAINERSDHAKTATEIDVGARATGLEQLRRRNFRAILDRIGAIRPLAGARLLDVGAAHGWFLDEAARVGAHGEGIEPEEAIAQEARAAGHTVRTGYFPTVVPESDAFDVVTFNDVLEHIPDVRETLAGVGRVLAPGGLLSINIPSADGLGYRVAQTLARAGVDGPYERFWQHGLPSPHQHYFPRAALARLVADCGFDVVDVTALEAISREGLWERVHTFRRVTPASVASYAALQLAAPVLNRPAGSDIVLLLARWRG